MKTLTSSIKRMASSIRRSRRQNEVLRNAVALPLEVLEGRTLLSTTNEPPVAADDVFYVAEDGALIANLLANDVDPEGDALTAWEVDFPAHGPWSLDRATGQLTYTPDADFNGMDQFSYWLEDS